MDQILACTACAHAIGVHSADGCTHQLRLQDRCACVYNASDVVEATLRDDETKRAMLLSEPFRFQTS